MNLFTMKGNTWVKAIAAAGAVAAEALPVAAYEVYTFEPPNQGTSGPWNDQNYWLNSQQQHNGYPDDDNDDAIIPAGLTVEVHSTSTTGSVNVQESGGSRGVIKIFEDAELQLGTDRTNVVSVVNGYVVFITSCIGLPMTGCPSGYCPATLRIMFNPVTITSDSGKNGEIRGRSHWSDGVHPAFGGGYIRTENNTSRKKLILEGSVRLVGHLGVYCELENNATVMVDDPRGVGTNDECDDCDEGNMDIECEYPPLSPLPQGPHDPGDVGWW